MSNSFFFNRPFWGAVATTYAHYSAGQRRAVAALAVMLAVTFGSLLGLPSALGAEEATQVEVVTVNINTADAATLAARLKGVGESRAAEIIRYREAYGPFASADELMEVKGIGKSTVDLNRQVITLE